jgi:3-hydroxybutyryl-CoA dehydrogenase
MQLEQIKNISIIGAGTMGHGIGLAYALGGHKVILHDINEDILRNAISQVKSDLETFAECGLLSRDKIIGAVENITTTTNLQRASKNADFVTEAVSENVEVKKKVFTDLDAYCPDHTILATNTSSLTLRDVASQCKRQDKILICHWMNPPHILPAVEVAPGEATSDETMDVICALLKKVNKAPIRMKKEIPGLLHARVQMGLMREIWSVWQQGIASPEDIDLVVKGGFGLRLAVMGPLQMCDMGGLDIWYTAANRLFKDISDTPEPPEELKKLVEAGNLGVKTGKGFLDYGKESTGKDQTNTVKKRDRLLLNILKLRGDS